jgi:DNA primase
VSQISAHISVVNAAAKKAENFKITPMRRAIGLLLQHPKIAAEIPLHPQLHGLKIAGMKLFLALHEQTHQGCHSTAQLLERWRDSKEESALRQLVRWEHHLDADAVMAELCDIFVYFIDQFVEQRASQLLEKERETPLNQAEKREYQALLRYRADKGKANS